jgi:cytochrome P450
MSPASDPPVASADSSSTGSTDLVWDPYDEVIDTTPYDIWRRMRDEAPVYRNDAYDFWAYSRYEDVNAASRSPLLYSSAKGTVLEMMGNDLASPGMIIFMDPPEHDELRILVSRAFTPRRISALEDQVSAICAEYLDPQIGSSGFDYLTDFGMHLPSRVISALLGVPGSDQPSVLHMIDTMFHVEPGVGMINDVAFTARIELYEYLAAQLAERRDRPTDDMLTALTQVQLNQDGVSRSLTQEEAVNFALLLVSAGTETVARLLGWAAVVLADHPDQRALMAADPSLVAGGVEELLRYEAPSPVQGRLTTDEVELHGVTIPTGSKVLLLTGSAGRDERQYPEPDRFDVRRKVDQHMSLGIGTHYCVGAALARLEGRIALTETLKRFPEWDVDPDRAVRLHTSTVRGYKSVPIQL